MRRGSSRGWRLSRLLVGVGIVLISAIYATYSREMRTVRQRISTDSQVIQTEHGPVEFITWGKGPAVLAVHGAGGGYDQGRSMTMTFGGEGYRWIVPSRFGYLRSSLPTDASTAAQAVAFASLLDHLGIERVAILAMSGGVPPSLQFALRYPKRTSALVLLSTAPYTPLTATQQKLPVPIWIYQALFSSDFPYWVLTKIARPTLEAMFDVRPELRRGLTPDDHAFVSTIVDGFEPVTMRLDGVGNEGAAIDPKARYPLADITAPTLVIHARDDGINPFAFGQYTTQQIPGAVFMPLDTGGHLLLGHQAEVKARVNAFLKREEQGSE